MMKQHTISFKHAFDGLFWALKTQPNYRVHLLFSALSLLGAWYFHITSMEFLIVILLITIGLTIETINTAIESTTDAIDENINPKIKTAKDTAAAAMLIFAIGALIIACIIFIPRILLKI